MVDLARLLEQGRQLVEPLLTSSCAVTRDAQRTADDVLDPDTLELVRPIGDTIEVWTGPCLVLPTSAGSGQSGVDDMSVMPPSTEGGYVASLPTTAPRLEPGDVLTITSSDSSTTGGRAFQVTARPPVSDAQVIWQVPLEALP